MIKGWGKFLIVFLAIQSAILPLFPKYTYAQQTAPKVTKEVIGSINFINDPNHKLYISGGYDVRVGYKEGEDGTLVISFLLPTDRLGTADTEYFRVDMARSAVIGAMTSSGCLTDPVPNAGSLAEPWEILTSNTRRPLFGNRVYAEIPNAGNLITVPMYFRIVAQKNGFFGIDKDTVIACTTNPLNPFKGDSENIQIEIDAEDETGKSVAATVTIDGKTPAQFTGTNLKPNTHVTLPLTPTEDRHTIVFKLNGYKDCTVVSTFNESKKIKATFSKTGECKVDDVSTNQNLPTYNEEDKTSCARRFLFNPNIGQISIGKYIICSMHGFIAALAKFIIEELVPNVNV